MSDFGFMSSGLMGDSDSYEDDMRLNISAMLSLFIGKAFEDSMKYIQLSKRNAITKYDLEMALKFQAIKFFNNPNIENELAEVKQELLEEIEGQYYSENEDSDGVWEDVSEEGGEEVGEEAGEEGSIECGGEKEVSEIVTLEGGLDDLLEQFTANDEDCDEFKRVNLRDIDVEDRNFINDIHKCCDSWDTWTPENDLQKTIFNAIEAMTARF